ncbi:MAG: hypothetical protein RLZZ93_1270 [Actinomycetota bacterium]
MALPFVPAPAGIASAAPVHSAWAVRKTSSAHGGSVHATTVTGASALYRVAGKRFAMWYVAGPRNGRVAVFVNGKKIRTVDQYSPRTVRRAVTFTSPRADNTVMVVALSTRSKASKGTHVNVDAFSPLPGRCAKGCTKSPVLVPRETTAMAVSAEAPWYSTRTSAAATCSPSTLPSP